MDVNLTVMCKDVVYIAGVLAVPRVQSTMQMFEFILTLSHAMKLLAFVTWEVVGNNLFILLPRSAKTVSMLHRL
jgi:hypothetical protein